MHSRLAWNASQMGGVTHNIISHLAKACWQSLGAFACHRDPAAWHRASTWQHGCLYACSMAILTPIIQVCMLLASHPWCNHAPTWSSSCLAPSLVPQNCFCNKLSFLISEIFGIGPQTLSLVHSRISGMFQLTSHHLLGHDKLLQQAR